jgi:hypothetical protein
VGTLSRTWLACSKPRQRSPPPRNHRCHAAGQEQGHDLRAPRRTTELFIVADYADLRTNIIGHLPPDIGELASNIDAAPRSAIHHDGRCSGNRTLETVALRNVVMLAIGTRTALPAMWANAMQRGAVKVR